MRQIEEQIKDVPPARPDNLPVTGSQLRQLADSGLFEVGSHTVHHPFLARLSPLEQSQEIGDSKAVLEEMTGKEVSSFSCPHGSYDTATSGLLKEFGYRLACTSRHENVSQKDDPYTLPRKVVENWDGVEFEQRIKGWIKT